MSVAAIVTVAVAPDTAVVAAPDTAPNVADPNAAQDAAPDAAPDVVAVAIPAFVVVAVAATADGDGRGGGGGVHARTPPPSPPRYITSRAAHSVPASIAISGFTAPPWGTTCKGPEPPSLGVLSSLGLDEGKLEMFTDLVLRVDSASHPSTHAGGTNREILRCCMAALLM